jgi:hypothetical protein
MVPTLGPGEIILIGVMVTLGIAFPVAVILLLVKIVRNTSSNQKNDSQ